MIGARLVSSRRSLVRDPLGNMNRETTPDPDVREQLLRARDRRIVAVRCGIRLASDPQALAEVVEALGLTEEKAS